MIVNKVIRRLRIRFFSGDQDEQKKMVAKWWADGGDSKFRFDYDLNHDSLVLDLGGYKGQWASDIFSRYQCRVMIFEPVSHFADRIQERFAKNEKIEVFSFGLGGSSRKEKVSICEDSSSIFRNSSVKEEIEIVDVAEWIDRQNVHSIQLMKINIEGGEYELLERLIDTGLIKIIENIQLQFHNISEESPSRMELIQKRLRETHLPTYQYRFVWENWAINKENAVQ
jgi:FkbM family methyltransferase